MYFVTVMFTRNMLMLSSYGVNVVNTLLMYKCILFIFLSLQMTRFNIYYWKGGVLPQPGRPYYVNTVMYVILV